MISSRKRNFLIAILVIAICPLIFLLVFQRIKQPEVNSNNVLPIYGFHTPVTVKLENGETVIDTAYHTIPKFSLINQNGDTVTDNRMKGVVSVVDFFFTTCPSICIDMTKNMRKVQDFFKNDNSKFQILSFSVDPETDTPDVLLKYAYQNDVNSTSWSLLTGDKPAIYDLARKGFLVTATEGDGGPNDFIHDNKFVLIDREGRIRGYYDGTSSEQTDKLILDIQKLLVSYIMPMKKSHSSAK
ncbi:MAG: SCO family protein [Chitinophagales bacterium]|nr:SCO family protein [Chitinophagales bacterium]